MKKFYQSISYKFAMFVLAVFIIVMGATGYTAYMGAKEVILTDQSEFIAGTSIRTEYLIQGWFREQFTKLEQVSSNTFMVNHINRIVHSGYAEDVNKSSVTLHKYLESAIINDLDVADLTIINVNGSVLVSTNDSKYDMHNMYNLEKGLIEEAVQFVNYNLAANDSVSYISVPIQVDGKTIAMLVAHLDNEGIIPFIEEKKGMGNSGVMYLLNPHNYLENESSSTALHEGLIIPGAGTPTYGIKKALNREEGVAIYKNSKGIDVLGSFRWIDDLDIGMIIEIDADEVLQPINDLKRKLLINIIVFMLFFTGFTLIIGNDAIRSIKNLKESAEEIAMGNLKSRVNITRKDEIGELASAFNSMVDDLDAMTNKLEKKVEERTAELANANDGLSTTNAALVDANDESARINEELEKANKRLLEVDRLKSEFLNTMSHELRTPLTAIIGYSSLLHQKMMGDLNSKQEEYAVGILRSGNHLLELINEILDLSKIEAGMMKLVPENVHVLPIIEYVMMSQKPMIAEKGHTVEVDVAEDLHSINVDKVRLKQILINLASNAIKFTDDGGHIIFRSYNKGGEVYIDVIDNGIGIKEEDIPKLFKKFSQLDQKLSRKYVGTGLGLAIVKQFTELMGGRISMESTYGKGSTFRVVFPAHHEAS